ncbi:MAG TPA: xanthine dehydrogenase family protein molybdopterin-binding subunit [Gammaproteobacteria bacterium]|nr:xanthine dehydrogenase family protein molybdopterin-binding subunit [Gammaproteobacteria bacterium]
MSIGAPLNRFDGPAKVTGKARYSADVPLENLAHAVIVGSTIARGSITQIDTEAVEALPGVLGILTPLNAPRLPDEGKAGFAPPSGRVLSLLQDRQVHYNGQPIAVIVAETLEQAERAACELRVAYQADTARVEMASELASAYPYPEKIFGTIPPASKRGDVEAGLAEADVRVEATYTTPVETHNPMEPHATVAQWQGDRLTLYDSTQYVYGVRRFVAKTLGLPEAKLRVVSDFVGGAFGSKGSAWSHVVLAAMAARHAGRPVKLALTRRQMFGLVGARPYTVQHMTLGAKRDGTLTAIRHESTSSTSEIEEWLESAALVTRMLYAVPNQETSHRIVPLNLGTPTFNRAPGEAPGTFALESAMDELAESLDMDPLALRIKNYAELDPHHGLPWSSKSLRRCYAAAAEHFGWARRNPRAGSMREGEEMIGWGMATATYPARRMPASAAVRVLPGAEVVVRAASHDLGTGTYTVLAQVAADALGIPADRVRVELGDTNLPESPISAGSMTAASVGTAVHQAALDARGQLETLGRREESFESILAKLDRPVEGRAQTAPGDENARFSMYSFGAVFVEVRIDASLGTVRVRRIVGAYAAGRILNAKTARSQLVGGIVYGLGQALHEHTAIDARTGRYLNADLSEYLVPVNADVPEIDVMFVDEHDSNVNPIGVKGIGEIGTTGVAAAIANAVRHATGVRVRDLPITLDKLTA